MAGILQPFRSVLVSWSGSGELPTLSAAEAEGASHWLTGQALVGGFYLNELLMRLVHRYDPHPGLFTVYHNTVQVLGKICSGTAITDDKHSHCSSSSAKLESALRIFERHLLDEIGYGLVLEYEVEHGQAIEAQRLYNYHMRHGPVGISADQAELQPKGLIIHGQSLLDLARGCLDNKVSLREVKRLMRVVLAEQLGERPVNSRRLFTPQYEHS